jgi:hypothetical protein
MHRHDVFAMLATSVRYFFGVPARGRKVGLLHPMNRPWSVPVAIGLGVAVVSKPS